MIVGVYASPIPEVRVTVSESVFVPKFQRYSFPSSLLTITDIVPASTAAVLMHHSRTALGYWAMNSGSGVGPAMVRTSFITSRPLEDACGSTMVAFGSGTAILFAPSPPSSPAYVLYFVKIRYDEVPVYVRTIDAGTTDAVLSQPNAPGVLLCVRSFPKRSIHPRDPWNG